MIKQIATIALSSGLLAGCGILGNAFTSDKSLANKASFYLGEKPEQITISDRSGGIIAIDFTATPEGKEPKKCYVDSLIVYNSDAICEGKAASCNALLKAAGKCD